MAAAVNWMFMVHPSSYVEAHDGIRNWGLGRWGGHEDGAIMSAVSALMKEAPESSLTSSTMWEHSKKTAWSKSQKIASHQTVNLLDP